MWRSYNGVSLPGRLRILTINECNIVLETKKCVVCEEARLSLSFKDIDNWICLDCLLEVIDRYKFFSTLEEKNSP